MCEQREKGRRVYRLAPCPRYDVAGMESWLADMALEGKLLCKFVAGVAVFNVGEPQRLRYRLTVEPEVGFLDQDDHARAEELAALCAAYGWQYVAKRGGFMIFATDDEDARELDTDGPLQASMVKKLQQSERLLLGQLLFGLLVYSFFYWYDGRLFTLLSVVELGSPFCFQVMLFFVWLCGTLLFRLSRLRRLRTQMEAGTFSHEAPWRTGAARYRFSCVAFWLMFLLAGLLFTQGYYEESISQNHRMALEDYGGGFPFATLTEVFPDSTFQITDRSEYSNFVEVKADLLAPCMIDMDQTGRINRDGSCIFAGSLSVEYYELRTPRLAQILAQDRLKRDQRLWRDRFECYQELELPPLDVDYGVAYKKLLPTIILVDDCRVLYITYSSEANSPTELSLAQWAQFFAADLQAREVDGDA